MMRKGPLITLLAGLAIAGVLLVLNVNAASTDTAAQDAAATGAPAATPAASASPAASPDADQAGQGRATYAGRVGGGGAAVAVAVRDGQAIAYLCDGRRVEAWLKGTASGGKLALTGADQTSLTGTYGNGTAEGTVAAGGRTWTFDAPAVKAPSGLYRATGTAGGAKVEGGWIVLPGDAQLGILAVDGNPGPAPELDTSALGVTAGGRRVSAVPVDGETGSGF